MRPIQRGVSKPKLIEPIRYRMKLSNFDMVEIKGRIATDITYLAEVDVTTGVLWWKKTQRRQIFREYAGSWYFIDNGEFTPGFEVEKLYKVWKHKTNYQG